MNAEGMTESGLPDPVQSTQLSPAALAEILNRLDVAYVYADGRTTHQVLPEPATLLASLSASSEARLRTALIPLLLRHPEFAQEAASVANRLSDLARTAFVCYYSAAVLLQRKHASRLAAMGFKPWMLPHLFSVELELSDVSDPDEALRYLAARHRVLSGQAINWLGTYEHAAERWMRHMEKQQAWAA